MGRRNKSKLYQQRKRRERAFQPVMPDYLYNDYEQAVVKQFGFTSNKQVSSKNAQKIAIEMFGSLYIDDSAYIKFGE